MSRTAADPNGVSLTLLKDGQALVLRGADLWGRFYQGESTDLRIVLKRHQRFWFDSSGK